MGYGPKLTIYSLIFVPSSDRQADLMTPPLRLYPTDHQVGLTISAVHLPKDHQAGLMISAAHLPKDHQVGLMIEGAAAVQCLPAVRCAGRFNPAETLKGSRFLRYIGDEQTPAGLCHLWPRAGHF